MKTGLMKELGEMPSDWEREKGRRVPNRHGICYWVARKCAQRLVYQRMYHVTRTTTFGREGESNGRKESVLGR